MDVPDLAVDEGILFDLPDWELTKIKTNYKPPKTNSDAKNYTIHSFKWTDTEYTPSQLLDNFFHHMPFLVLTTAGYLGRDEGINSVSSDEIYWVKGIIRLPRVIVVNDSGAYFSIPITCKTPVIPLMGGALGKPITIKELLDKSVFKSFVFTDDGSQYVYEDSGSGENVKFGMLKIIDRYDERYLLVHTVTTGDTIYHDAAIIPLYLPTALVIAVAMAEGGHRDFYRNMLKIHSFVRSIPKEVAFPLHLRDCEDIMIFDHKPKKGTYDVLLPSKYATSRSKDKSHVYTPLVNWSPSGKEPQRPLPRIPTGSGKIRCEWQRQRQTSVDQRIKRELSANAEAMENYGGSRGPNSNIGQLIGHDYNIVSVNPVEATRELHQVLRTGVIPLRSSVVMVDISCCSDPEGQNGKANRRRSSAARSACTTKGSSVMEITGLADIPEDLSLLDCAAVGKCLTLLQLSKHRTTFEREQIDGQLLVDLDADILQQDFAFSKFEALKLSKFIRGWRPNANETSDA